MTSLRIAALASVCALALAAIPLSAATAAQAAPTWAQDKSDLKADPMVRFGVLPNGMRYALMHNATPSGQASFRLRFDAGSLMETDAQQGLAHFLEHMAFNGSTHVATGDTVKILERLGLAFGADTNASTDWTETIYKFDLPKTDDETIDTGLMLMREVGGELTIPAASLERERGVVLSEERLRDTPGYRAAIDRLNAELPGQLVARRLPIGKVDVIQHAPRELMEDFYKKYYRPDRAVFVAVGDFDVAAMEAKVKARFGDWKNPAPVGPEPVLGEPAANRPLQAGSHIEAGLPTSVQVSWLNPPDLSPDTRAKRRRDMVDRLALAVLNRRLGRITRDDNPPFLAAGANRGDEVHSATVTTLSVNANGTNWKSGLETAVREEKRLVQYGVLQSELDREIEELRVSLKQAAASAATRRTPGLANGIVGTLDDKVVYTAPGQDLALFEDIVKGLKADEVSAAAKTAFKGSGPLVYVIGSEPIAGGNDAILAAYKAADAQSVTAPAAIVNKTWPYESFGPAGQVTSRTPAPGGVATYIRFANGVRLTVKPTAFRKDQVQVQVRVGHGKLDLPKDKLSPTWARSAFIEGGLGKVTAEELDQIMTSRILGASFDLDDDAYVLSGTTRPSDLKTQLQVLTAYDTDPGFRPEAFNRVQRFALTLPDQMESTPAGVAGRDLQGLYHSGDQRWVFPSKAYMAAGKNEDLKALVGAGLKEGPIEVIVVGDTTVEDAVAAVASTFAALPPRKDDAPPTAARQVKFPSPTAEPVSRTHKGRADQAYAVAAWPTTDLFADMRGARANRVMVNIMQLRMTDELRVAQGATYSPSASLEASEDYPGFGFVYAAVEIPPSKIQGFYDTVGKIAADLAAKPPTDDEMKRAVLPRIEALEKAAQTNDYWLSGLAGAQTDPRRLEVLTNQIEQLKSISAADVQRAAQRWLDPTKAWRFQVTPAAK